MRSDGSHYEKHGKGEPVCIDDEIPFEIPESWEWVRLGDIGDWKAGATPAKGESKYYSNGTIPWLLTGDLTDGLVTEVPHMITEQALRECSLRINPIGSVLVAMYGATIGKIGILGIESTTNQACCACILHDESIREWLVTWLRYQKPHFIKKGEGGAQPNISRQKIVSSLFPLPPQHEQLRIEAKIAELLLLTDEYGALEDGRERLDAELPDRLRKSILQMAVQGKLVPQDPADEPASALLERIRAELAKLVKAGKLKAPKGGESVIYRASDGGYYEKRGKSEPQLIDVPFDIPDGWEWARVSSVFNLVRGSGIKRTEVIETGEPCVRYGELYTTYRSEITLVASHTSSTVYDKAQKLHDGEVVVTLTGENDIDIGRAVVNNTGETIAFGGDLLALKGNYLDGNFAMLSLNAPYMGSQRTAAASGNIIVHLSADKIGNFLMAVPPLDEQRRIVSRCKELLATVG